MIDILCIYAINELLARQAYVNLGLDKASSDTISHHQWKCVYYDNRLNYSTGPQNIIF